MDALRFDSYGIEQLEFDLPNLDLEMEEADGDLKLVFPDGKSLPLTDDGFSSLSRLIGVPHGFAKKLREDGRSHVLAYLQKQLGRAWLQEPAIVVIQKGKEVVSVTSSKNILPDRTAVMALDTEIRKAAGDKLVQIRYEDFNVLYYFLVRKEVVEQDPDKSEYEFYHVFDYSVVGHQPPKFYQAAKRCLDNTTMTLPFKPEIFEVGMSFSGNVISHVENLDVLGWGDLCGFVGRLSSVKASLQEVKEARSKLRLLKIDKEDHATAERVEAYFVWKKIVEAYDIKSLETKPSKKWFMSAPSPYTLFYVQNRLANEATHAPDVTSAVRSKIQKLATKFMKKMPDLAEKAPPKDYPA